MSDKLILTDVDGVLLDYMQGYEPEQWVQDISEDDHWRRVEWLEPYRDAEEYLQKFFEEGWKFHAITAVGAHPQLVEWRMNNLKEIFGYDMFTEITCVPKGRYKPAVLQRYAGSGLLWIEDHVPNANMGFEFGLDCRLFDQKHNSKEPFEGKRLNSWQQLYEELVG